MICKEKENLVAGQGCLICISDIHTSMFRGKTAKLVQNTTLVSAARYTLDLSTTDFACSETFTLTKCIAMQLGSWLRLNKSLQQRITFFLMENSKDIEQTLIGKLLKYISLY